MCSVGRSFEGFIGMQKMGSMPWWVNSGSQDEPISSPNRTQIDWVGEHQKSDGIGSPEKDKQGVFHLSFSAGKFLNF